MERVKISTDFNDILRDKTDLIRRSGNEVQNYYLEAESEVKKNEKV